MDEDWLLYSVTSFTFAVIFFFCYIRHVFTFFERNKIPRTVHPTFPFGNVYNVVCKRNNMFMQLWAFYNRFKRKKCAFGGFYIFLKPAVIVMDTHIIGRIFKDNENTCFEDVHDSRHNVFNFNNFNTELSTRLLNKILDNLQQIWLRLVPNLSEEQEINFTHLINKEFASMVLKDFFDIKYEFYDLEGKNTFAILQRLITISYPHLNSFFKKDNGTRIRILGDRKEEIKTKCIWQMLTKEGFSEEEIKDCIFFLACNLRKINNVILFTLFELSVDEEIQADLRAEIIRFKKSNFTINYEDLSELEYLETVVCETLRKYPVEPFMYKMCKKDYFINDVKIPKDILFFASIFGVHHDEKLYTNPERFDPDRFCKENLKFIDPTKYLPFGFKNENDFDIRYLKLIVKITLVELLSRFQFSVGKKSPKTMQFDASAFDYLQVPEDIWLKISV